ncbi:MAG: (d)CMP kinase [Betaproteobacteria bacterium]|nr:(d)CMP kinase [Betaproteobacteria bacterium]
MRAIPVIAIDGPSASGKGTVAQAVAQALGFHYLDSGALYRVLGLAAVRAGVNLESESEILNILLNIKIKFEEYKVMLEAVEVSDAIREEPISAAASKVSAHAQVRRALLDRQRAFRQAPGLVADGRDMGSVVFPDAALKIYLTASAEARAERRYKQLIAKGLSANMADLFEETTLRDQRDSERAVAPLKKCADAIEVDSTNLPVFEVVALVLQHFAAISGKR